MFKEFEDFDDSIYRPENFAILKYCHDNYKYNSDMFIEKVSAVQEETNILQESMEEEIDEIVSSLDEKDDEESEEPKEEERISYPCPPSNESNSSTPTLFNFPSFLPKDECHDNCYDPVDSFEISLFDELDACYACGHDGNMNYAYGDELAIFPYVKNEIVAIAHTHDSPIIFLNSPNYTISEKFAFIKDYIDGLRFTITHDDFDRYNMHVLAAPSCNYYER